MSDHPYQKIYHKAKHMTADGLVSPLCAKRPKALDLAKELWTLRDEAVTCKKCKALLSRSEGEKP